MNKCPHCNGELELDKTGALICKLCRCTFRLILVRFDTKCYNRTFKEQITERNKEVKNGKKKRGRPRKIKEEVNEE